ncbi:hypothetical protein [Streptomyces sp. NPDC059009]|uniref:hypothetical protein n=1 Tax=Streptomyces sp. NPDC059009 TaxID=3346694 RepID=UPI00368EF0A2
MLTVLVLAGTSRASELIAQIEGVPELSVVSHTYDGGLALARARTLLPDVLVIDLSARFSGDATAFLHEARHLDPPVDLVVHEGSRVLGTVCRQSGAVLTPDERSGGLARTLAALARHHAR